MGEGSRNGTRTARGRCGVVVKVGSATVGPFTIVDVRSSKKGSVLIVSGEVLVPEEWVSYVTKHTDIFMHGHCGYWAQGVERLKGGWLVREVDETDALFQSAKVALLARDAEKDPKLLPKGWHYLDGKVAVRAFLEGATRWGIGWYEDTATDATFYDDVVQRVLFGELKYG